MLRSEGDSHRTDQNSPLSMASKRSLQYSQESATVPYPEPAESIQLSHFNFI
jgi:hypothetical protein